MFIFICIDAERYGIEREREKGQVKKDRRDSRDKTHSRYIILRLKKGGSQEGLKKSIKYIYIYKYIKGNRNLKAQERERRAKMVFVPFPLFSLFAGVFRMRI